MEYYKFNLSIKMQNSSDDVDIKHEPLEEDMDAYVSTYYHQWTVLQLKLSEQPSYSGLRGMHVALASQVFYLNAWEW